MVEPWRTGGWQGTSRGNDDDRPAADIPEPSCVDILLELKGEPGSTNTVGQSVPQGSLLEAL